MQTTKFNTMFEQIGLDLRYAFGRFKTQAVTYFVIVLTLALGIGATTAIFSVVNGMVLQATPFKDSEQLVVLRQQDSNSEQSYGFSASELSDYQAQSSTLESIAEYHNMTFTMYGHDEPVRVRAGIVSSNFFELLDIKPILGRAFTEDEDDIGAEPLLLLTYEFWQREFDGRHDVINRSVEFNNRSHKIIGVLPHFPQFPNVNDIYMAIPSCPWRSSEHALSNRSMRMMGSIAKRHPDTQLADVNRDMATIAQRLNTAYPEAYSESIHMTANAVLLHDELVKESRPYLLTLLGTTLVLFLIAIANVTNLTLSLQAKRKREFAVRASLGASKGRVAQQLLTESLILSIFAGLLGLSLAYLGLDFLKGFAANFSSLAAEITMDWNVMLFSLALSVLAGTLVGLAPSLSNKNLVTSLKEGGKASFSTEHGLVRNGLMVGQFTLSLILLIGAGLTGKSLDNLQSKYLGFEPESVNLAQLDLNWTTYANDQDVRQMAQQILQQVRNLPYAESAALAMTYPLDTVAINNGQIRQAVLLDDRDVQPDDILQDAFIRPVSPGYFETLGTNILQGRAFNVSDDELAPGVIIISSALAERFWPNETAIDHSISLDGGQTWLRIVGIAADVLELGSAQASGFRLYLPFAQSPVNHMAVLVKSNVSMAEVTTDIKSIVYHLDSRQPFSKFETLRQAVDNSTSLQGFLAQLLIIFSAIALFITASGVSGVISYMVDTRTREIGIRMAIGANRASVTLMVLAYGLKLATLGLLLGLGVAYANGSLLSSQLFGLNPIEWGIYLTSLATLLFISVLASAAPAWRASRMPPTQALRSN